MAALQPQPVPDQPTPESRLNVEAQEVTRSQAAEQVPDSAQAAEEEASGAKLGVGAITQSVAKPVAAPSAQAKVQAPQPTEVTAQVSNAPAILPTTAALDTTPVVAPLATKATSSKPQSTKAVSSVPQAVKTVSLSPNAEAAPQAKPILTASLSQTPASIATPQADPVVLASLSQTPNSITAPEQAPSNETTPQQAPASVPTPQQIPDVTASKAVLAFPASGPVDPVSIAAFQSFTQTDAAAGTDVRDSLSTALSIPCSRMQVTFDPDTTTLQLTGHVPNADQRGPVLAALQAQMGTDIAVSDNLLILPAPQCAALSGIASVGLPQSTDQITNPKVVGPDTHARAFRYVSGEALVLELTAPDYPAYVYVDYFDADGNVIHLAPNERAPLQEVVAKSALQIGARTASEAGLFVTIGPPYGQEIAAAFAASVPLYEGNRPLVEPADAYLDWLKTRVADARAAHLDFKGEWVYFFVTTAAD